MNVRSLMQWLVTITVLLVGACELIAQPDIQLSPTEPRSRWLLPDLLVQSAAHIGDTTLVVWGATANLTDTSIVPLIRMRMLIDTLASGAPTTLSDEEARPYGVVAAMAVGKKFLVLWNDRGGSSPGIHACSVAPDGSAHVLQPGEAGERRRVPAPADALGGILPGLDRSSRQHAEGVGTRAGWGG